MYNIISTKLLNLPGLCIAILLPFLLCLWYTDICLLDSKGYYAILGVSEKSKYTEIRAAYRLLAKKYHPDRNNSDFAEDMIKKLNAAFEVLSNREKRSNMMKRHLITIGHIRRIK